MLFKTGVQSYAYRQKIPSKFDNGFLNFFSNFLEILQDQEFVTISSVIQSQKPQGFCVGDFATLSDERRSRSKIVLLFDTDKRTLLSKIWKAHGFENYWIESSVWLTGKNADFGYIIWFFFRFSESCSNFIFRNFKNSNVKFWDPLFFLLFVQKF